MTANRTCCVYILAGNSRRLYIGVTSDLGRLMRIHRMGPPTSFTARYQITKLVYYESTPYIRAAIAREKQLKGWVRRRPVELVESTKRDWIDLAAGGFDEGTTHPAVTGRDSCNSCCATRSRGRAAG